MADLKAIFCLTLIDTNAIIANKKRGENVATRFEKLRWTLYQRRRKVLYLYGLSNGLIKLYDDDLIERLRHIYYGGIPASILLLYKKYCNGRCYDSALLLSLGFQDYDYEMLTAEIDGIKFNPHIIDKMRKSYGSLPEHYAAHRILKVQEKDGREWIYDTSLSLVFEKNFYFKLDHPTIIKTSTKQETIDYIEYQEILHADFARDKVALPLILPQLEPGIQSYTGLYAERLKSDLARFKEEIDYEGICSSLAKEVDDYYGRKKFHIN